MSIYLYICLCVCVALVTKGFAKFESITRSVYATNGANLSVGTGIDAIQRNGGSQRLLSYVLVATSVRYFPFFRLHFDVYKDCRVTFFLESSLVYRCCNER